MKGKSLKNELIYLWEGYKWLLLALLVVLFFVITSAAALFQK